MWWMPWYQEPKKGVASCDKPRGAARWLRSVDARMGKPGAAITRVTVSPIHNGTGGSPGTETSQYRDEKKAKAIP